MVATPYKHPGPGPDGPNRPATGAVLHLRAATAVDCAALAHIVSTSQAYDGKYRALAAAICIPTEALPGQVVRIAEKNGAICGFYRLDCRPGACELDLMFVANEAIATGVGRALFADMVAQALARDYDGVLIISHPPAAGFYQRMGAQHGGVEPPRGKADWERPRFWFDLRSPQAQSRPA